MRSTECNPYIFFFYKKAELKETLAIVVFERFVIAINNFINYLKFLGGHEKPETWNKMIWT